MKLNCLKTGKNKVELNLGMKKYVNQSFRTYFCEYIPFFKKSFV